MEEAGAERVNKSLEKQLIFYFSLLLVFLFLVSSGERFLLFVIVQYCFWLYSPIDWALEQCCGEEFGGIYGHTYLSQHYHRAALGMDHPHPKRKKVKQRTAYPWHSFMELKTISPLSACVINIHKWPDPSQAALLIGKSQTQNEAGLVPEDNMLSGHSIAHSCCWGGTIESVTNVRGSDALYSVAVSAKMIFEAHLQELNSKFL